MYALVDCNNFYVSCERIFDYSLLNRPVAILSNNDGCVIAQSNEFKELDFPFGIPYFQLKPFLKRLNIRCLSSNYELYGDISRRVMSVLSEHAYEVEIYSIDEAFLQITLPEPEYGRYGRRLRQTVLKWVGVPVSIGFAPTKTLSKIANRIAKKRADGVFVMPADPTKILLDLPLSEIWGIGRRLERRLNRLGISNAAQFAALEDSYLKSNFNVCVARTALELRGEPALEPEDLDTPAKSIMHSRAFGKKVMDFSSLREALANYTAQAAEKMRKSDLQASAVNVYVELGPPSGSDQFSGGCIGGSYNFPTPLTTTSRILNYAMPILARLFEDGKSYRKIGVMLYGLEKTGTDQLDLFERVEPEKDRQLYLAVDQVNRTFGRDKIFHLSQGISRPWQMRRGLLSPGYTTRWSDILTVT